MLHRKISGDPRATRRCSIKLEQARRKTQSHSQQMRGEFRPTSPRAFGQLGLNCDARGKAGFRGHGSGSAHQR